MEIWRSTITLQQFRVPISFIETLDCFSKEKIVDRYLSCDPPILLFIICTQRFYIRNIFFRFYELYVIITNLSGFLPLHPTKLSPINSCCVVCIHFIFSKYIFFWYFFSNNIYVPLPHTIFYVYNLFLFIIHIQNLLPEFKFSWRVAVFNIYAHGLAEVSRGRERGRGLCQYEFKTYVTNFLWSVSLFD